jgi:hypothetical protein
VPKQKLDLFQLATTFVAQPSARATEVTGGYVAEIAGLARMPYNAPDDFGTETMRGNPARFLDRAEDRPFGDLRLRHPGSECFRNPERDWHGPHMTTLADEIGEYPMFFSLLQILNT